MVTGCLPIRAEIPSRASWSAKNRDVRRPLANLGPIHARKRKPLRCLGCVHPIRLRIRTVIRKPDVANHSLAKTGTVCRSSAGHDRHAPAMMAASARGSIQWDQQTPDSWTDEQFTSDAACGWLDALVDSRRSSFAFDVSNATTSSICFRAERLLRSITTPDKMSPNTPIPSSLREWRGARS